MKNQTIIDVELGDRAYPITIGASILENKFDFDQWIKGSPVVFVWAPEQDLDVMVEMAGAGGGRVKDQRRCGR